MASSAEHDPMRAPEDTRLLRDPAMVITESCTKEEAFSSQKSNLSLFSKKTEDLEVDEIAENEVNACTSTRVIQKTEDRTWLEERTQFQGGFLLDSHGSMLMN